MQPRDARVREMPIYYIVVIVLYYIELCETAVERELQFNGRCSQLSLNDESNDRGSTSRKLHEASQTDAAVCVL